MVYYEIIRKEDQAKVAVEATCPKAGAYDVNLYDIYVIESESHPRFGMDDEGNPTVFGQSDGAVLIADYVGAGQKQKELETKVADLTARLATAEAAVTSLKTRVVEAEGKIVVLESKVTVKAVK